MSGIIQHGIDIFGQDLPVFVRGEFMARVHARLGRTAPALDAVAEVSPAFARVDAGRWIVDCPDCKGAGAVWLDWPVHWCCDCGNDQLGGLWRPVAIPTADDRDAAERVLAEVPAHDRFWRPEAQSLNDLRESITQLRERLWGPAAS